MLTQSSVFTVTSHCPLHLLPLNDPCVLRLTSSQSRPVAVARTTRSIQFKTSTHEDCDDDVFNASLAKVFINWHLWVHWFQVSGVAKKMSGVEKTVSLNVHSGIDWGMHPFQCSSLLDRIGLKLFFRISKYSTSKCNWTESYVTLICEVIAYTFQREWSSVITKKMEPHQRHLFKS